MELGRRGGGQQDGQCWGRDTGMKGKGDLSSAVVRWATRTEGTRHT